MDRRRFLKGGAWLAALGAVGLSAGKVMAGNRYYQGPRSDHFDGLRFFNPGGAAPSGFGDLMRWRFNSERAQWPASVPVTPTRPAAQVADLTITMVGHATMLVQMAGLNLLTDPVWSDRASPLSFAGPRRATQPGIAFADLPHIDAVLLSHAHYDHLDLPTLHRLKAAHDPLVITPLGNDAILRGTGLRCAVLDWGQSAEVGPLTTHAVPCHHWSARGLGDRSHALWAGFVVMGPTGALLHIGDTGFDQGRPYATLPERFGPLRAAILPIGAYAPRWFMAAQHQNPDEAVQGFRLSGARWGIGHHWGTFQLTDEARDAPPTDLAQALAAQSVAPDRFRALAPGEAWAVPA